MKRLLLGLAVLLAACAPGLTGPGAADPGGARLALAQGPGYRIVRFEAGRLPTTATTITLYGLNLAVNDPSCKVQGQGLVCDVGPLPAERVYLLPVRGALVVGVTFGRPDGRTFELETDGETVP